MATQNRTLKHLAIVSMLLSSAAVLVYACGGDDTTGPTPITPTGGSSGAGGSTGGSVDTGGMGGTAGAGTGGATGGAAGTAGAGGGVATCEPSGTFDNATRLKGLLGADGGLPPL
jgi:hypothetical protein